MPLVPAHRIRRAALRPVHRPRPVAPALVRPATDVMHPKPTLQPAQISLHAPAWLAAWVNAHGDSYPDVATRMRLCIELSALNVEHETGGPFGAVVFDRATFQLISAGVNRVESCSASIAHAEIMAITAAQQQLGSFDLSATGLPECELATSCEPCAMCFGAIPWSGIRHLVCAAGDADARSIGFDEGPKLPDWNKVLMQRGISVATDVCRDEAVLVLQRYATKSGLIYNGRVDLQGD